MQLLNIIENVCVDEMNQSYCRIFVFNSLTATAILINFKITCLSRLAETTDVGQNAKKVIMRHFLYIF